jgi:hypothetical protein
MRFLSLVHLEEFFLKYVIRVKIVYYSSESFLDASISHRADQLMPSHLQLLELLLVYLILLRYFPRQQVPFIADNDLNGCEYNVLLATSLRPLNLSDSLNHALECLPGIPIARIVDIEVAMDPMLNGRLAQRDLAQIWKGLEIILNKCI